MVGRNTEEAQKQWAEIIRGYNSSGKSKKEYCKERGVSEKQFYYHQRRMREGQEEKPARQLQPQPQDKSEAYTERDDLTGNEQHEQRIVKLKITEAEQETVRTVRFTANGMDFALSEEISLEFLGKLLKAVSGNDTV